MRLSVMGAGYVGLVTGACLARLGHSVLLVEIDPDRRDALCNGNVPFHEPNLQSLFSAGVQSGQISVGAPREMADSELIMICVGTPLHVDGDADLSQVVSACAAISTYAADSPVVIRSTLPLGSTPLLSDWLRRPDLATVATNPEFLRQGSAVADFLSPTRIVIGTAAAHRTPLVEQLAEVYAGIEAPVLVTDFNSAEMIKNAANAFLATKLSFINEVADLCEAYGADVEQVTTGIGLDPRIGSTYLRPGIGFGGSCLPKELANMVRLGRRRGLAMPVLAGAAQTNDDRSTRIVDRIEELLGLLDGRRVAVLGLAFKPHTDDLRYSPALGLIRTLSDRRAVVVAHDPAVSRDVGVHRAATAEDAIRDAYLTILATDWPEYSDLDWAALAGQVAEANLFDGRNALDRRQLETSGWRYIAIGQRAE